MEKKLIEVALPLDAINKASAYEKMPGIGPHPRGLHLWWARRPLAAARAVIFAQMVDDPSAHPDLFPTDKAQEKERKRLFRIIEDLVKWENTTNKEVLQRAREEIWQSWRRTCAEHADHPRARELFDRHNLPAFHDPFAGGGALPLEAQRLGLDAHASDLNPVAVLINKAMIEIPPKFAGRPPVNPEAQAAIARSGVWNGKGADGLADDVRYYGRWMRDEADKRIGSIYPKIEVTAEMAKERPDLKALVGLKLAAIAWIWVRTVKSPNPAFRDVEVPLASTFMLASKAGSEAWIEPVRSSTGYRFAVRVGAPKDAEAAKNGTRLTRGASFSCLMSGAPIGSDHIMAEGKAGRIGARLMAVVAEGKRGRIYLPPTPEAEQAARKAKPDWRPDTQFFQQALGFRVGNYGMTKWSDLFTFRQLLALSTLSGLVQGLREQVERDALAGGMNDVPVSAMPAGSRSDSESPTTLRGLSAGGTGATAYSDAVAIYLALAIDRCADFSNTCTRWVPGNQKIMNLFAKQTISMTWDFAEAAVLQPTVGGFLPAAEFIADCIGILPQCGIGDSRQADAATTVFPNGRVVSTDPPYYDNIGYADLSDFFYVWLRRSLKPVLPDLFTTVVVPKDQELVATPHRHGGRDEAEAFFLDGMTQAMCRLAEQAHVAFPVTIYYAFKQSESDDDQGTVSTGWESFLDAVIRAGFTISGTWPMRSEQAFRMRGMDSNALASSIVVVCRQRAASARTATRREFVAALKAELPGALAYLQRGNIAPVDLAQSAIGPGMAVYTRYAKVLDAEGKPLSVREALALINETLDEVLAEQEGDFDADTRWALAWFEQSGFADGEYGVAETLSKAKNTSVQGMVHAGILASKSGKVRLLKPAELPASWSPATDARLTVWEMVHHLARVLEARGETAAAELARELGSRAEVARELAYRLYTICERKKRASEALSYNGLVQSWPEIMRLAHEQGRAGRPEAGSLFDEHEG